MDFSWLGGLFDRLLGFFNPLKAIQHWKIWLELKNWYERFKKWRDWYKQHVQTPFANIQKLQRQLFDTYMRPLLDLVDHIRQLTSIIGIFNRKLANQLNFMFLRVEGFLLEPFNAMGQRVNALGGGLAGIITQLGYLDRGTLLNSIWRDAGLIKEILRNPYEQHPAAAATPPAPTLHDSIAAGLEFIRTDGGPYAADVQNAVLLFHTYESQV